jgi:two-component system response regulator YesN
VEYLQHYLEDCYWGTITLDTLAASSIIRPDTSTAIFRHATGVPLLRYLSDIRMKKARELLESKTMLVKQRLKR